MIQKIFDMKEELLVMLKLDIQMTIGNLAGTRWIGFYDSDFYESKFDAKPWASFVFFDGFGVDIYNFNSVTYSSDYTYKVVKPDIIVISNPGDNKHISFKIQMLSPSVMVVTQMNLPGKKPVTGTVFAILYRVVER